MAAVRAVRRWSFISMATLGGVVVSSVGVVAPAGAQAAKSSACAGQPSCVELRKFVVTVADFQTSKEGYNRRITATVRFQNTSAKPIILGYLKDSGIATDDQGNRYVVYGSGSVRGMGEITSREYDPKFVLQPGESSDARFEFVWRPTGKEIYGTAYDVDLAVREIDPVTGTQYRLGQEHSLHFRRLNTQIVANAAALIPPPAVAVDPNAAAATATAVANTTAPAVSAAANACGAAPRCFSAGPFTADVVQVTPSTSGRHHVLQIHMRFRNVSNQPIILAYTAKSSLGIDNLGNRYYWGRAGTYDQSMTGMGIVQARSADPQFVLRPGESRNATFQIIRYEVGKTAIGTSFTYDLSVEQLQVLASQQVQSIRQHALHYSAVPMSASGGVAPAAQNVNEAVNAIKGLFKKKK